MPEPINPGVSAVANYRYVAKVNRESKTTVASLIASTLSVDKPDSTSTTAAAAAASPATKPVHTYSGFKKAPRLNLEAITNNGTAHDMLVIPTKKGAVGIHHAGHHFEFHFTRSGRKVYRCAWHSVHRCLAQVVAFERKIYVVSDVHSHDEPARISEELLASVAVK